MSSRNPSRIRFGAVPIGVRIPPILAPYAVASRNLILSLIFSLRNSAIGISRSVIVVFDRIELSRADVIAKAYITPVGVFGKRLKSLFEKYSCSLVFSIAIANIKPPKNRKMIDFE